ncbi:hypothetical protein BS47DRAFT_1386587 [Hydnum rufescens UP504]|uniref:Uncharacterized protein n=1 Tax=Hydnum rufescens UP504 TaxID=1448309 RepID=A0A9P6AAM0_9AGAM|nr:hypothetical protein BS47DRAFT_1386587 [Hydnum rufescens UP504]
MLLTGLQGIKYRWLFTEADIYGGVSIAGSVSQSSAAQFCVNPHFGVALNAGLTGSVLFCRANPLSLTFYNNEFPFGGSCFSSVAQSATRNSKRDKDHPYYFYKAVGTASRGVTIDTRHTLDSPAYVACEHTSSKSCLRGVQIPTSAVVNSANQTSIHHKRARVPFLPDNLFCPAVGSDILDTPSGSKTSPSTIPRPSNPFPGVPTTREVSTSFDAVFNMPPAAHNVGAHPPSSYQPLSFDDAFGSAPALPAFNVSSNQAPSTPSDVSPSPAPPPPGFRHSTSPRPQSPVFNSKASAASPPLPNRKDSTEPPASASRTSKLSLHFPFGKSKRKRKWHRWRFLFLFLYWDGSMFPSELCIAAITQQCKGTLGDEYEPNNTRSTPSFISRSASQRLHRKEGQHIHQGVM